MMVERVVDADAALKAPAAVPLPALLTGAAAVPLAFLLLRPDWLPWTMALPAAGIVLVAGLCWVVHLARPERSATPFFPVAATFYAVAFGAAPFLIEYLEFFPDGPHEMSVPARLYDIRYPDFVSALDGRAVAVAFIGVLLMAASFHLGRDVALRGLPHIRLPAVTDDRRLVWLLWGLMVPHMAYMLLPAVQRLPSAGQVLGFVGLLAFGMFYVLWRQGRLGRRQAALIFLVLLPVEVLARLAGGAMTQVMFLFLFAFLLALAFNWRFPWKTILAGVLFLALAYPVLADFRAATWNKPRQIGDVGTNSAVFAGLVAKRFDEGYSLRPVMQAFVMRTSLVVLLSHVARNSPEPVPYWRGETYLPLLTSFVPRFLWPDKPRETLGWEFRERYRLVQGPANPTVVNVPWLIEAWANFGPWGVAVVMALIGLFLAALDRLFNRPGMSDLERVTAVTLIFPLVYQESNFSLMVGSLLPFTLLLLAYFHIGLRLPSRSP